LISLYDATLLNSGSVKVEAEQDVVADSTGSTGLLSNVKAEPYEVQEEEELADVVSNTAIDEEIQTPNVRNSSLMKQLVKVTYFNNTNTTRNEVGTTESREKQMREPTCQTCGHKCKSASALIMHERTHSGERPFACHDCKKKYARKCDLKRHELLHSEEGPFSCTVCNRKFSCNDHLNEHMRIHSGEKPFVCKTCSKAFTKRNDLTRHERIHSGEKPFVCRTCSKGFARRSNLTSHERIHSGEFTPSTLEQNHTVAVFVGWLLHSVTICPITQANVESITRCQDP